MKKYFVYILLTISSLIWSEGALAQNAITIWKNGESTIFDVPDSVRLSSKINPNTITVWKGGISTFFDTPDSISFWNNDYYEIPGGFESEGTAEPTEMEKALMQMTSDEEQAPMISYSKEDSVKFDAMAQELISKYLSDSDDDEEYTTRAVSRVSDDDLHNGDCSISGFEAEQWRRNNPGNWGKSHYGGFKTSYNVYEKNGKKWLYVVFYRKGGFPNTKEAHIKLGQLNSGKDLGKTIIPAGEEYGYLTICIDKQFEDLGCANYHPLLINKESGARNYLTPIMVKTKPILYQGWKTFKFDWLFGNINGVSVVCNTGAKWNEDPRTYRDGKPAHQCVELCTKYINYFYPGVKPIPDKTVIPTNYGWGNAWDWPRRRKAEPDNFMVFDNNGIEKVREGDFIVWQYSGIGHIAVVIKVTNDFISIAHQNGGVKWMAYPIGTKLHLVNGVIKDEHPDYPGQSPIYGSPKTITHFIRFKHQYDVKEDNDKMKKMSPDKNYIEFPKTQTGESRTINFTITNDGGMPTKISSFSFSKENSPFSTNATPCTISGGGGSKTFSVTFSPKKAGEFKDKLVIQSNASDNPTFNIMLTGVGYGNSIEDITLSTKSVSLNIGETTTVNVTSGSGSYSVSDYDKKVVDVSVKGKVITIKALSGGSTSIKVTDTNTNKTAEVAVKVAYPNIALSTRELNLSIGETKQFEVTSGSGSYSVSGYDKKVVDVSLKGKVITVKALTSGNTSIKITDTNSNKTAEVAVKVVYPNIALSTKELSLNVGETKQIEVTSGSGSYSVSDYDKSVIGVSVKGKVITVNALSGGNTSIKVTDTNTKKTAQVAVKVKATYPDIALSTKEMSLNVGETKQIEVTSGSGSYSVSDYDKSVISVSVKGKVITVNALSGGNTSIKVTDTNTKKTAQVAVKVNKVSYPDIALSTQEIHLNVGEIGQIEITSGSGNYTTWIYDTKVAELSLNGNIVTVKALALGRSVARITDNTTNKFVDFGIVVEEPSAYDKYAVDLGLSVKWAKMNVGAVSIEDCGEHYAWGETESKSYFSWSSYDYCNGNKSTITKYNAHDGKTTLEPSDDAATVIMGRNWRTPTLTEMEELVNRCQWTPETLNGVNGVRVTGPNGNSIFLPFGGEMSEDVLYHSGTTGYYYVSTLSTDSETSAPALVCFGNTQEFVPHARFFGLNIRPVFTKK